MNDEQLEFEMSIAPKETQIEFAATLAGYIMLGLANAKRAGKKDFNIDATLPMIEMVKRAAEGKLRVVEINTATEIMTEAVKAGIFDKPTTVRVEL